MDKKYLFKFEGSREDFLKNLHSLSDSNQTSFYFNDFRVETSEDKWRFGVARGGHSGGYWYLPEISEQDGVLLFTGTIKYIDFYTQQTGIKKIINKIEETILILLLLPIVLIVRAHFALADKLKGTKEPSLEDKLVDLMENHLHCTRI